MLLLKRFLRKLWYVVRHPDNSVVYQNRRELALEFNLCAYLIEKVYPSYADFLRREADYLCNPK